MTSAAPASSATTARPRWRAGTIVWLVLGACLLIWWCRRPQQLFHPYLWDEESLVVGRQLAGGWLEAMRPVNGSMSFPAPPLLALGSAVAFSHLAVFAAWAATAVFAVTVVIIVGPESRWGNLTTRCLMALGMALVPTNPETFGVLLYSFWFATLWPVVILGWREERWATRLPLLAVASLSSPAAGALAIPFAVSWWHGRRRADLVSALVLIAGLAVEILVATTSGRVGETSKDLVAVARQCLRTAGLFVTFGITPESIDWTFVEFAGAVAALSLITAVAFLCWRNRKIEPLLLFLAVGIFALASALPAPLISHPVSAGPRYYFLPFVALTWLLLHLWRETSGNDPVPRVAGIVLLVSMLGIASTFSRAATTTTGRLDWHDEIERCAASHEALVLVPVYVDGSAESFWSLSMTPQQCRDRL
jgi:hypothetical protein